jgi:hypothetical protein
MSKAEVALFPGTVLQQSDLLGRWWEIGIELKRRVYDLPLDLQFEIEELLRLTSNT